jgi:hypothetical protein
MGRGGWVDQGDPLCLWTRLLWVRRVDEETSEESMNDVRFGHRRLNSPRLAFGRVWRLTLVLCFIGTDLCQERSGDHEDPHLPPFVENSPCVARRVYEKSNDGRFGHTVAVGGVVRRTLPTGIPFAD